MEQFWSTCPPQNEIVEQLKRAEKEKLPEFGVVYCGEGIGEIDSIDGKNGIGRTPDTGVA